MMRFHEIMHFFELIVLRISTSLKLNFVREIKFQKHLEFIIK